MVLAQGLGGLQNPTAQSRGSGQEALLLTAWASPWAAFHILPPAQVMERQSFAKVTHSYRNIQAIKVCRPKLLPLPSNKSLSP